MKIAFVGTGYVFDIYMRTRWAHPELDIRGFFDVRTARAELVAAHYGLTLYPSLEALLGDPEVEVVVNLTSIGSHYEVTQRALEAGKHVYSEKPVTTELELTQALFDLAAAKGKILTGAPCNLFCDAVATMRKAVGDGAIGKPVLVYAEMDDNPAHLMHLDQVQSPTGAPFPYQEELQEGCTIEHVAYHLVWICAMFGPVTSMTAFSKALVADKTYGPLDPPDTPDFSVGCLNFASGAAARITCSWVAPRDHRFRIIGEEGEITADNAFHDQSAVHIERFSRVGLAARKAYTLRAQPFLGRRFGVGGRRVPLVRQWKSFGVEKEQGVGTSLKHRFVSWLRRREVYAQDKFLGIAEMARAIGQGRPQPLPPDFLIHLNELTLLIQRAGPTGAAVRPTTTFAPLPPPDLGDHDYKASYRPRFTERAFTRMVEALHHR